MDALAFGRGPGAFTGVRIASGVIQGLAFGVDLPVIPVSTLAALAQAVAAQHTDIISAIDARMGEIYWGIYKTDDSGLVSAVGAEQVSRPEHLQAQINTRYYGIGSGWQTYHSILTALPGLELTGYEGNRYPHAADIIRLARREYQSGHLVSPAEALPVYLRNKVTG
jgi:tRNA threonylcarbamoyladenosine biosynthesis protein TsaB